MENCVIAKNSAVVGSKKKVFTSRRKKNNERFQKTF